MAAGAAEEQVDIFGTSRRVKHDAAAPRSWIQNVGSGEGTLCSPREAASRRIRHLTSAGVATSLHGPLTIFKSDEDDVGQREIFGQLENRPNDRRRRSPRPEDRMLRWRATEEVSEEKDLKVLNMQGDVDISKTSSAAGAAFGEDCTLAACRAKAAAKPQDDGTMVAIWGSPRRQASAGFAAPLGTAEPGFCWAAAPTPCKLEQLEERKHFPENRSRRLARSGSPMRDQLNEGRALAGETREEAVSTQVKYGLSPESPAGAAQMDVFGSPRRQKHAPPPRNPSPCQMRSSSPATRTWRWLETPREAPAVYDVLC